MTEKEPLVILEPELRDMQTRLAQLAKDLESLTKEMNQIAEGVEGCSSQKIPRRKIEEIARESRCSHHVRNHEWEDLPENLKEEAMLLVVRILRAAIAAGHMQIKDINIVGDKSFAGHVLNICEGYSWHSVLGRVA